MEKLLLSTYVQTLWALFVVNNTALGIEVTDTLTSTLTGLWQANADAGVSVKDLPAATLQNLYELVTSQNEDALNQVKAIL